MRHHACERATAGHNCPYCGGRSLAVPVLSTVHCRTTPGAIWQTIRLNMTHNHTGRYRWFRYGKSIQLD